MKQYHHIRQNYGKNELQESMIPENPAELFSAWFDNALKQAVPDANAMVLSTAKEGRPSSRIVLLKELKETGFVFFTNYNSRKAREISTNQNACLLFFWPQLEQQIRIEGLVEKVSEADSIAYFQSRPFASQIGATVSRQSEILKDKQHLKQDFEALLRAKEPLKKPANWGGYQLIPDYYEFWQGGADRLHDRVSYKRVAEAWEIFRLYP
ncbi:MAG: pyridoxamine 5'-phosphate oxidase [Bacteroidetes bacterium]|jgi:pyridoxamine 5'-phosphate oxidase|nr:pyridoxamine 5'-phosphate oxidase [Bacteroidota bacterium]